MCLWLAEALGKRRNRWSARQSGARENADFASRGLSGDQKTGARKCSTVENCASKIERRIRAGVFDENLKAIFKKFNCRYKRWRKCLKKKQCPIEQTSKKEALAELLALAAAGLIELYFGDESGFWQNPVIARAWQFAGEEIRLLPEKGKRVSVFGLLNQNCEGKFWASDKTIHSEFVINCLEEWLTENNEKPRVLVLDNAGIHRSKKMRAKLSEWEEKGFYIFNLPTYSPHLNIIEMLWRKMKYEWLKPEDYISFESLTQAIREILSQLGTQYKINFKDRVFIK